MRDLLRCSDLSRTYGNVRAVEDVNLSVAFGSRHALIGPNGAGKSTLLRLISGGEPATSGQVWLNGNEVTRWSQPKRARAGIGQTFQHSSLFPSLTVSQNVALASQRASARPWWPLPRKRSSAHEFLSSLGLIELAEQPVRRLSYAERRRLEVAVALANRPSLLLLDEPAAGMSATETVQLTETLRALPSDVTVVFVEHDLDLVFALATQVTVLHLGRVLATGEPNAIRADPQVRQAYLGKEERHAASV